MDNRENIVFVYKGRYFVRDTETICYLSTIAKNYGYNTELVYDANIFGVTDNVFYSPFLNQVFSSDNITIKKILMLKPDLVVFLLNFNNFVWIKNITKSLKNLGLKFIILSPIEREIEFSDNVLTGIPEESFNQFLGNYADITNLIPDKDLFAKYVDFSESYMVYSSRGCVANCSYCEESLYKKLYPGYFRKRDYKDVIEELKIAKQKYNPKEIIFKDTVFTIDKKWLKNFLSFYREYIKIPFKCFAKANYFDEEICLELKNSGCYCIEFGVQTLNQMIKKNILFRDETEEEIKKALSICDKHCVYYDVDLLFGIPEESVEDHKNAILFFKNCRYLNRIKCHNLVVYPYADIRTYIKKDNHTAKDFFSGIAGDKNMVFANKCFQKIFKILPLLNKKILNFILKHNLWIIFYFIPYLVIIFLQLIIAIKNNDRRFKVYLKFYPKNVLNTIKTKFVYE